MRDPSIVLSCRAEDPPHYTGTTTPEYFVSSTLGYAIAHSSLNTQRTSGTVPRMKNVLKVLNARSTLRAATQYSIPALWRFDRGFP